MRRHRRVLTRKQGTNDLGPNTLLTGDEVSTYHLDPVGMDIDERQVMPNATIASVTACTIDWAKELYDTGVRNFLFQNVCRTMFSMIQRRSTQLDL